MTITPVLASLRNLQKIFTTLFTAVFMSACTYKADNLNFINIDQSAVETPVIDFLNSEDTIYLRSSVSLDVSISDNVELIEYEILIGNRLATNGFSSTPFARFDSEDFVDGIYTITLRVITKSNSGSIADQFELETLVTEFSKTCIIDNRPVIPEVRGFILEDGSLKLAWNEYEDYNFEQIVVQLNAPYSNRSQTVSDPSISEIGIPEFVGGSISGSFLLAAKNEEVTVNLSFVDDLGFDVNFLDGQFYISMEANPYSAVESVSIRHQNSLSSGTTIDTVYALENRSYDQEVINISQTFPMNFQFWLEANSTFLTDKVLDVVDINNQQFPLVYDNNLNYFVSADFITASGDNTIVQYDRETGQVLQELTGDFALSSNGEWLYEFRDTLLINYDPVTLSSISATILTDFLEIEGDFRRIYVTNANQVLFYSFISSDPFGGRSEYRSYLFDKKSKETLKTRAHRSNVFQNTDNRLTVEGELTASGNFFFRLGSEFNRRDSFIAYITTSQNDLLGEEKKRAILLTTDNYLVGNGSDLVKRDYAIHSAQLTKTLDGEVVEVFSNFDNLCAVIILKDDEYEIVILDTENLEEITRLDFNESSLDFEKRFVMNTLFLSKGFGQIYTRKIDE